MSSRLMNIKIQPYNQVLALTQHMINQGIDNLYKELETLDPPHESQEPVFINLDRDNFIENAVFGAPSIIIDADYSNVKSVKFLIHLKSGQTQLCNYIGRDKKGKDITETLKLKVEDWTITVPVDVGFVKVDPETDRGKAIVERSAAKGKPNHSIHELLVDLSTMTSGNAKWDLGSWNPEDTFTGRDGKTGKPDGYDEGKPRDYIKLPKDFRDIMGSFLVRMTSRIAEWNLTSMGFAVMADDVNQRATFEVSHVRYMTYPWTDPQSGNGAIPGLSGDGRLNYLLYLETVADNKVPKDSDPSSVLSTRMGNWTEGRNPSVDKPSIFGSFVLSADQFMDKYLLPKLACINRVMSADITSIRATARDEWLIIYYSVGASWGVGLGESNKEATEFALSRNTTLDLNNDWQNSLKDHMRPLTQSPGNGATVWAYKDVEWGSTAKHAKQSALGLDCSASGDTVTYSRVYTLAGSNKIVFEGRIWTKLQYTIDPPLFFPKEEQELLAKVSWKVTFTLTEVSDGGLQITIDADTPDPVVTERGDGKMFTKSVNYKKRLVENYQTAAQNFNFYLDGVRNILQGQEKFTLPASGVFFFKDPMMDHQGNLLCGIEYNGNPKLKINPGKVDRTEQPVADYNAMPGVINNDGDKTMNTKDAKKN